MKKNVLVYFLLFALPVLATSSIFAQHQIVPAISLLVQESKLCSILVSFYGERLEVCRTDTCADTPGYGESCQLSAIAEPDVSFGKEFTAFHSWADGGLCITATNQSGEVVNDPTSGVPIKLCDSIDSYQDPSAGGSVVFGCGLGIDKTGDIVELCDPVDNPALLPDSDFNASFRRVPEFQCSTEVNVSGYQQSKRTCRANCFVYNLVTYCDEAVHYF